MLIFTLLYRSLIAYLARTTYKETLGNVGVISAKPQVFRMKLLCETVHFFSLNLTSSTYSLRVNCRRLLLQLITFNDTHTIRRGPLDEGSVRRREFYLTTYNIHPRQTDTHPPVGFETALPANERPQNHALDRAATEIS